jgi:branched-subunit amino acid ABC-type transport system permease component
LVELTLNFAQIFVNSLITGSIFLLASLGLSLTYGLLKFPNVAHAEYFTFGAYMAVTFSESWRLGFPLGIVGGFFASALLGLSSYLLVFRLLSRRGAGLIHMTVASVGWAIALRFSIQQIWGREIVHVKDKVILFKEFERFDFGPVRLTELWVAIIFFAVVLGISFHLLLSRTRLGKAIRATADNPSLAMASGINTERVLMVVWFLGSGLAGVGGILRGADARIAPIMGFEVIITAFAVVILGGIGSFYGTLVGSYVLGFAENLGVVLLALLGLTLEYRTAVSFVVLVLVILLRPEGIAQIRLPSLTRK